MKLYVLVAKATNEPDSILGVYQTVEDARKALQVKLDRDAMASEDTEEQDLYDEFIAVPFELGEDPDAVQDLSNIISLDW